MCVIKKQSRTEMCHVYNRDVIKTGDRWRWILKVKKISKVSWLPKAMLACLVSICTEIAVCLFYFVLSRAVFFLVSFQLKSAKKLYLMFQLFILMGKSFILMIRVFFWFENKNRKMLFTWWCLGNYWFVAFYWLFSIC